MNKGRSIAYAEPTNAPGSGSAQKKQAHSRYICGLFSAALSLQRNCKAYVCVAAAVVSVFRHSSASPCSESSWPRVGLLTLPHRMSRCRPSGVGVNGVAVGGPSRPPRRSDVCHNGKLSTTLWQRAFVNPLATECHGTPPWRFLRNLRVASLARWP